MSPQGKQGGLVVFLSVVLAMMLDILPLPMALEDLRPEWLSLTLIYWVMVMPHRIGVGKAWLAGLFMDALTGTLLGLHALVMAALAYIVTLLHNRLKLFPRWQQAVSVLMLTGLSLLLLLWLRNIVQVTPRPWTYWLPALTSACVWPAIYHALRVVQGYYRVQ
ncbi:MAG: rod shape-determining protein MreD [Gammaproteobacteria bacterium]|nr:rod shape-determining protein MreD [Gammaproteobacteria bacterium]